MDIIPSFSFLDVTLSIAGPGGSFSIRDGSAPEGCTIAADNAMTETTTGADGSIMHSLVEAGKTATVTINLLKTSPVNAQLSDLIESQGQGSATWGQNTISIVDKARGDDLTIAEAAFVTIPANGWAAVAGTIPWSFRGRITSNKLGAGVSATASETGVA